MIICDNCGKENPDLANVCSYCGHGLWDKGRPPAKSRRKRNHSILPWLALGSFTVAAVIIVAVVLSGGPAGWTGQGTGEVEVVLHSSLSGIVRYCLTFEDSMVMQGLISYGQEIHWNTTLNIVGGSVQTHASAVATWNSTNSSAETSGTLYRGGSVTLHLVLEG
jgi:DNA-directed RNA polymerase subunit RPC12/RpoP